MTSDVIYGTEYGPLFFGGIVLSMIYGVGIPYYLFRILRHAKERNLMGQMDFMQKYGFLYMRYNRDYYYWEIVILFKKFALVFIQIMYNDVPEEQAQLSIGLMCVFLYVSAKVKPFVCYPCLKQRKKRCKHWSPNDQLEFGTTLMTVIMLSAALSMGTSGTVCDESEEASSGDESSSESIGYIIVACLAFSLMGIVYVVAKAFMANEKEIEALKEDGLYDDRQKVTGWVQKAIAM
jgi:hypothetical protein